MRASATAVPASRDRRTITVVVAVQFAISLGYYAVMAHVVGHLRHDLGLLAGTVALVLAVRVAVQNMLFLATGALTDALGPARAGALACGLRAASFALLGLAEGLGGLLCAVVLMAVGGALFHPAAQSALAGAAPEARARGFSAYVVTGQLGAVAGPPVGLALLAGGFGLLAAAATAVWGACAGLFLLLRREPGAVRTGPPDVRRMTAEAAAVLRDRPFVRFALAAAPTTLLTTQVATVVPLKEPGAGVTTLFFCVVAVVAAAVQPWRGGGRPRPLGAGLLCAGAGYLVLLAEPEAHPGRLAALVLAAALHGAAAGLTQTALFRAVARTAPPDRFGVHFGLLSFLAGAFSLVGGLAVGALLDSDGMGGALLLLSALAALTAAATWKSRLASGPPEVTAAQ
ncbi:hypothetical protein GCM10022221_73390 [Actinocorallia aurea]